MTLTRKERMAIPRQAMPQREALERARHFDEVNLGFTEALAIQEAERCIRCPVAKCIDGCPVGIQIDEFIIKVSEGDFAGAAEVVRRDNLLPSICGRVCPQEVQCEGACVLGKKHEPVAIGYLERFVGDYARAHTTGDEAVPTRTGKRVAIVGSGPAGLTCAADLARLGHQVTVFEALHELGGVLIYGIPEYRLPKDVVRAEIDTLRDLGVEFVTNAVIGKLDTLDDLLGEEGYDAVFLGVGAGLPRFMNIPGEDLVGVYSANEFLTRVNLMKAYRHDTETPVVPVAGRRVAVIGGGNTALDAVRTALRMGASEALLYYRRTEAEMPARREEIDHALEEGVILEPLVAPVAYHGDDEGRLCAVTLQAMELGEPGADGRRRPVPVEGRESTEEISVAVIAIGNGPNPLMARVTEDLVETNRGTLRVDDELRTTKRGVFAGGDIVTGGATVILAMGAGRRAAAAIDEYLREGTWHGPAVDAA